MSDTMLAAVVEKPGELAVREVPLPVTDETECLVEILACAICNSTDHKLLAGRFRYKGPEAYPGILGHEAIGRVVQCGKKVSSFKQGDLVLRPMACYSAGEGPTCMYGGLAQFGKVREPAYGGSLAQQVIPPEIGAVDATMLVTLKETLSWLQHWEVRPGQSVVVLGSGPVGLSFGLFARLLGCRPVLIVGRRHEPLQRALRLGLDGAVDIRQDDPLQIVREFTGGKGADRAIEAAGSDEMLQLGLSLLAPEGRIGVYGIASTRAVGDMERRTVEVPLARNQWGIDFLAPQEHVAHEHVLWLVKRGILRLCDWYTHVVPLADINTGFELLEKKQAFKVVVDVSGEAPNVGGPGGIVSHRRVVPDGSRPFG